MRRVFSLLLLTGLLCALPVLGRAEALPPTAIMPGSPIKFSIFPPAAGP